MLRDLAAFVAVVAFSQAMLMWVDFAARAG
jgi:hypothetical protein